MMIDLLNWGLRTGVVISGLIGLVLLLRRPFARYFGAEATFLLWSLPLIRLCIPDMYLPVKQSGVFLPYDSFPMWDGEGVNGLAEPMLPANGTIPLPPSDMLFVTEQLIAAIVITWLGGAALWLGYHIIQHVRYGRLLRHVSADYPTVLGPMIRDAAQLTGLKNIPQVKVAPKNIGPLVSGLINPIVILPKDFTQGYSRDAQSLSLVHEFAHVKRRDLWSAFAALLFRALHWFNPLVHYAARRFRDDLEAACDAYTLSKFAGDDAAAHEYACTLLRFERADITAPKMPVLSLALSENYEGGTS